MAVPQWGKATYDNGKIPVPVRSYKCKGKATVARGEGLTLTHHCKIGIDHDGDHQCICGKTWAQLAEASK
jgi:hypothetical protein